MKQVAKYNTFKGVSTALTFGTPLVTLACCGDMFVHRSETAISAAGVFAIIIAALFFRDKIAEQFKAPSALVVAIAVFVLVIMVENILEPIKYVCVATIAASGVDEFTFKSWYKAIERRFPKGAVDYKHIGFVFTSSKKLFDEAASKSGNTESTEVNNG